MNLSALAAGPLTINLNQTGSSLHWSIFTVSVANLALIAVMVVIFGAALLEDHAIPVWDTRLRVER